MKKVHMPNLRLRHRLLLYAVMIVCVVLSVLQVIGGYFDEAIGIVIYVLAAGTFFFSCYYLFRHLCRILRDVIYPFIMGIPFARRVVTEYRLRTIVFTVPGALSNIIFAVFNGAVGLNSHSAWFGTMAAYYILLSIMRVGAVNKERRIRRIADDALREKEELAVYYRNSILFIFMALVLGGAVVLLEYSMGGKEYPGFTIYAVALYSFYKIILSTINLFKVKKHNSMLLAIIRRIGYLDACVSILLLQTALFHAFAGGEVFLVHLMNGITGSVVSLIVLFMGIYGLCITRRKKRKQEEINGGKANGKNIDC